jgi:NAD(P)H dehydrogenase (quinone)
VTGSKVLAAPRWGPGTYGYRGPVDTLVVWAHPRRGSFSEALRRTTEDALVRAGHQVQVIELYQEGFSAVMGDAEWQAYRDFRPEPDAQLQRHIDLLRRAEQLVFVYPTWWFGLPAILKGWLERTMVPGVAFDFDPSGQIRGSLGTLRRIVAVVTYGSAPWYVHLIGDAGRRTLTRALRLSTSVDGSQPLAGVVSPGRRQRR